MANTTQNGAPVFVAPTPIVNPGIYYTSPDSAYPQTYANSQQQQPPASGKYNVLLGKTSAIWLGAALLLCGVLSQIGAAVALRSHATLSEVAVGLWCGYMFMATGAIAIVAGHHGSRKLLMATGAIAIVAGHHGTRKLIIGTTVTSGLSVVAAIAQLSIAGVGLDSDTEYFSCYKMCNSYSYSSICYTHDWESLAIGGNGTMAFAASLAIISGVLLLAVGCIALRRKQTSFQMHSTPVQHVQQQQLQMMPLNHPPPNTIQPPMSSQVVQMPVPYIQTMNTSMMPNQQVLCIPIQYVQQHQNQQQQLMPLNHPPPNSIDPTTSSQMHGHHDALKNHDADC